MNKKAGSLALAAMFFAAGMAEAARSKAAAEAALPNSAFASVERGTKGETVRRLPYRDASGKIDVKRLRSALRMFKRVKWDNAADEKPALAALKEAKTQACAAGQMKCGKIRKTAKLAKKPSRGKKAKTKKA